MTGPSYPLDWPLTHCLGKHQKLRGRFYRCHSRAVRHFGFCSWVPSPFLKRDPNGTSTAAVHAGGHVSTGDRTGAGTWRLVPGLAFLPLFVDTGHPDYHSEEIIMHSLPAVDTESFWDSQIWVIYVDYCNQVQTPWGCCLEADKPSEKERDAYRYSYLLLLWLLW